MLRVWPFLAGAALQLLAMWLRFLSKPLCPLHLRQIPIESSQRKVSELSRQVEQEAVRKPEPWFVPGDPEERCYSIG